MDDNSGNNDDDGDDDDDDGDDSLFSLSSALRIHHVPTGPGTRRKPSDDSLFPYPLLQESLMCPLDRARGENLLKHPASACGEARPAPRTPEDVAFVGRWHWSTGGALVVVDLGGRLHVRGGRAFTGGSTSGS